LVQCRGDITRYTQWHKIHIAPFVEAKQIEKYPVYETDLKAMSEYVDLLIHCYWKNGLQNELPSCLERLRGNNLHPGWQRKILYFQVLAALGPDWSEEAGRRELAKLGSIENDGDTELLELYLDLNGSSLSFSEKQRVIDRIIHLTDTPSHRLHYRCLKGIEYFTIGDSKAAKKELTEAISEYRAATASKEQGAYSQQRFAMALELLGSLTDDQGLLQEALQVANSALNLAVWTIAGQADLHRLIGDVHRHREDWPSAMQSYKQSLKLVKGNASAVFLALCQIEIDRPDEAYKTIVEIDRKNLENGQDLDYVFTFAVIAMAIQQKDVIAKATEMLKGIQTDHPFVRQQRDSLLLAVLEISIQSPGKSTSTARGVIRSILRPLQRYLMLQPNFMGIGIDVNKALGDLLKPEDRNKDE
jgi:tetratricopeptide (TPR) repeat protein